MLSKLVPIVGHLEEDSLGIDEKSEKDMAEQVDVIVSCGASTRFDERLVCRILGCSSLFHPSSIVPSKTFAS